MLYFSQKYLDNFYILQIQGSLDHRLKGIEINSRRINKFSKTMNKNLKIS